MTKAVRTSYSARAREYADLFLDDLDRVPFDREWLTAFAEWVSSDPGRVVDAGCGVGNVVDYLTQLGLEAIGFDLSPAMIGEARRAFPTLEFHVGDFTSLDVAEASLAGVVSRYSLIHTDPARFGEVFEEWFRILKPGAPALVSFFASSSSETHGQPFDHAVVTAYELFPEAVVAIMGSAGFERFEVATRKPIHGERALDHGTILARRATHRPGLGS